MRTRLALLQIDNARLWPNYLDSELRSSPVSALEVVSNLVIGSHSDPVGHLSVLLLLLGQLELKRV